MLLFLTTNMDAATSRTTSHSVHFFPNKARSHWLLRGHRASNNKTVSRQQFLGGQHCKFMTSEGKTVMSCPQMLTFR